MEKDERGPQTPLTARSRLPKKTADDEEDNRVFYVGVTRAEEHLVLSASWGNYIAKRDSWAKLLNDGLEIDLKGIDAEPQIVTKKGVTYRLFRTDQDPPPIELDRSAAEAAALPRIEPLPAGGQADHEVSATAVSLFAECPRKYYLSRYLGLETPVHPDPEAADSDRDINDPTELGRSVHAILAALAPREDASAEALRLVETFEKSPLGAAAAAGSCERELSLVFPVGRRLIRGVLDLLIDDGQGGGGVLVDYKTDRVSAAEAAERAAGYAVQLQLYALALEQQGRKPARAVLHFLRPDAVIDVDLAAPALQAAADLAERLFQAQEARTFDLNPGPRCYRCPHFRGLCPSQPPSAKQQRSPRGQLFLGFEPPGW